MSGNATPESRLTPAGGSDAAAAIAAVLTAIAMIAAHVVGRATRDALFLTSFDIAALARMVVVAALVSLPVLVASSRSTGRYGPARLIPVLFGASAALFVAEWGLAATLRPIIAVVVYLHLAVLGPLLISGFWLLVNERFDPHTARRYVARITAGATLGGIAGGVVAERLSTVLGATAMLLVLAGLHALAAVGVLVLGRSTPAAVETAQDEPSPTLLRVLGESRHVRNLAALVAATAAAAAILDFVLKAEAQTVFATEAELLRLFAVFYMATSVGAFLLSSLFGRMSLGRLGIAGTLALLPAALLGGAGVAPLLAPLTRAITVAGLHHVLQNSLFRAGYELLYSPLSPRRRRPTKAIIDVGFDRIGQTAGGVLTIAALWLLPAKSSPLLLGVVAVLAATMLGLALSLRRSYVTALEESLQRGSVKLDDEQLVDRTTRTVWESSMSFSRASILEALAKDGRGVGAAGRDTELARAVAEADTVAAAAGTGDAEIDAALGLRSSDPARIRTVLRDTALTPALVAHAVPLLARDAVLPDVVRALRRVAPDATGQLVDRLLSSKEVFAVRRRLPRVLRVCGSERAASGLFAALGDRRFDVRHHAALALVDIVRRHPELTPEPAAVFAAARREVEVSRSVWESQELIEPTEEAENPVLGLVRERTSLSLEHVFTILSLALDREPLKLAFRALDSAERRIRGTAIEYLENVLPPDIRQSLWPYLGLVESEPPTPRPRQEIVDELLKSNESVVVDPTEVRRRLRVDGETAD